MDKKDPLWEETVTRGPHQMNPLVILSAAKSSSAFTTRDSLLHILRNILHLNSRCRRMQEVSILYRKTMKNSRFLQVFIKMRNIIIIKMKVIWKMIIFRMRMTSEMTR